MKNQTALLLGTILALGCATARAQSNEAASGDPPPNVCAKDAQALCAGLHPGDGKFGPCMKRHVDELSGACQTMVREFINAAKDSPPEDDEEAADDAQAPPPTDADEDAADGCRAQVEKACPGLRPGDGQFGACIKEHKDDFSQTCREAIQKKKAAVQSRAQDCRAKIAELCPDLHPGDEQFGPCLREHQEELTGCGPRMRRPAPRQQADEDDDDPPPRDADNGKPGPEDDHDD